jgi:Ca2+-binding RTX toxin-like protein
MSCKSWRWRGDGNLTGTSGNDWLFGGRGNNTVDAGAGHDFIWTHRGNDVIDAGDGNDWILSGRGDDIADGGAGDDYIRAGRGDDTVNGGEGNDKVFAGSGDDTGVYSVAENGGSKDYYNGGHGTDVLILRMTHAEFESGEVQADLDAFDAFLNEQGNSWRQHAFQFKAFDLKVKNWERYEIEFTDAEKTSKNEAPTATDDRMDFETGITPIQEVESNDPDGRSPSTNAQVIERSAFRIAPGEDVGDDALPRVSIAGTISGSLPVNGPDANDVDLFAVTLQAGEKLIIDVDYAYVPGSPMNAQLFVMDENGVVLADNDDALVNEGGAGSVSPRDPYLDFSEPGSGGTYYVAVSTWDNDPQGSSGNFNDRGFVPGDYVLNMSVDNPAPDLGAFVISANDLLGNDFDADGDALTITSVDNAVNGQVELGTSGEVLFKPAASSPGSFEYTVSDGEGNLSTATVTVNGNFIAGTSADETLVSTSENDLFEGRGGSNTFNFSSGSGNDVIADFNVGLDALAITDGMSAAGFETLGNNTLVNFDTGDSVLLVGVSGVTDVNDLFA